MFKLNFSLIHCLKTVISHFFMNEKLCKFYQKFIFIFIGRISFKFFLEFYNLNMLEKINIFFLFIIFSFFSLRFLYFKFKLKIQLNYNKFVVLYFSNIWKIIFFLLFIILYLICSFYMVGFVDCSDVNNKNKLISIGGGVLVVGGLSYIFIKPIISKIIVNSQTELLNTLQENNINIYSSYHRLYEERCPSIDLLINSYVTKSNFESNLDYTNKKLRQPLVEFKEELKVLCEVEINGIFKTPSLVYGCSYYSDVNSIINQQVELLGNLNMHTNTYNILVDKLKNHYDINKLTDVERSELINLVDNGMVINDLYYKYVTHLITIGDKSLTNAVGMDLSVSILHQKIDPLPEEHALLLNAVFYSEKLKLNPQVMGYERLFFDDINYNYIFLYDIILISVYGLFCIVNLYTYGGNPIPKDYFIGSYTRLFSLKKTKIHKYEDHDGDKFWKLSNWL
jgi:hypothetical protein